jgi:hypothetical protein
MLANNLTRIAISAALAVLIFAIAGCGDKSPVPYQQLQVQSAEDSQGWDVYMYIAVDPEVPPEDLTKLLEWFRDVRFADQNKIQVFIWDNPQSAIISAMGDMVASLTVDREAQIDKIDIFKTTEE